MKIQRWGSGAIGRHHTVARGDLVWTVANATSSGAAFEVQVEETFALLEASLLKAGSSRYQLLSVQVLLVDIANRDEFNGLWCRWIGDNPEHWPQRAVFQAALAPGLALELIVTACRD
jgi:enamine deaminase RidA (YjgF/YER057c/UK114 family)